MALQPHGLERIAMADQIAALPRGEQMRGGLDVGLAPDPGALPGMTPPMPMPSLAAWGGVEDANRGYSANLVFQMPVAAMGAAATSAARGAAALGSAGSEAPITFGAAGLMIGHPMAGMGGSMAGFPEGTYFTPYAYLRNTTARPLSLSVRLGLACGDCGQGFPLPPIVLPPRRTIKLPIKAFLPLLLKGASDGGAIMNWSATYTGAMGDLNISTGSVDRTGTYVFTVVAQPEDMSAGQLIPTWSLASGDDTMITLWNQDTGQQRMDLTFTSADGKSQYTLPVTLAPGASTTVDLAELAMSAPPDPQGNGFPAAALTGSAMLMPAKDGSVDKRGLPMAPAGGLWHLSKVVVSAAVYNVTTATCCYICSACCGYSCPEVFIDGDNDIPIGSLFLAYMTVEDVSGGNDDCTADATWYDSSANFLGFDSDEAELQALEEGLTDLEADMSYADIPPTWARTVVAVAPPAMSRETPTRISLNRRR
ncbi:MAG: hypothetical protein ACRD1A_02675 [Terriglobales bacterium]